MFQWSVTIVIDSEKLDLYFIWFQSDISGYVIGNKKQLICNQKQWVSLYDDHDVNNVYTSHSADG